LMHLLKGLWRKGGWTALDALIEAGLWRNGTWRTLNAFIMGPGEPWMHLLRGLCDALGAGGPCMHLVRGVCDAMGAGGPRMHLISRGCARICSAAPPLEPRCCLWFWRFVFCWYNPEVEDGGWRMDVNPKEARSKAQCQARLSKRAARVQGRPPSQALSASSVQHSTLWINIIWKNENSDKTKLGKWRIREKQMGTMKTIVKKQLGNVKKMSRPNNWGKCQFRENKLGTMTNSRKAKLGKHIKI